MIGWLEGRERTTTTILTSLGLLDDEQPLANKGSPLDTLSYYLANTLTYGCLSACEFLFVCLCMVVCLLACGCLSTHMWLTICLHALACICYIYFLPHSVFHSLVQPTPLNSPPLNPLPLNPPHSTPPPLQHQTKQMF